MTLMYNKLTFQSSYQLEVRNLMDGWVENTCTRESHSNRNFCSGMVRSTFAWGRASTPDAFPPSTNRRTLQVSKLKQRE